MRNVHGEAHPQIFMKTLALKHRLFSREGSLLSAYFNTFILYIRKQTQRSQSQEQRQHQNRNPRSLAVLAVQNRAASAFFNVRNCIIQMRLFLKYMYGLNTIAFVSKSHFLASWMPLSQDPQPPPSLQFFLLCSKLDSPLSSISNPPVGSSPLCPEPCPTFILSKVWRLKNGKCGCAHLQIGSHNCQRDKS